MDNETTGDTYARWVHDVVLRGIRVKAENDEVELRNHLKSEVSSAISKRAPYMLAEDEDADYLAEIAVDVFTDFARKVAAG